MVQLTITSVVKAAIDEYCKRRGSTDHDDDQDLIAELTALAKAEVGGPIDHHTLVQISKYLVRDRQSESNDVAVRSAKRWCIDILVRGASIYKAPPPPQKEPVSEPASLPLSTVLTNVADGRLQGFDATIKEAGRATTVRAYGQPCSAPCIIRTTLSQHHVYF